MKILCPTCDARYCIADQRVAAGGTIRCRGCGGCIDLTTSGVPSDDVDEPHAGAHARGGAAEGTSETSELFSLAALTDLAQASATVPEESTGDLGGDDSSLIDLRQLMASPAPHGQEPEPSRPQRSRSSKSVVSPLGMVPLGVSPLGTPLPVETTPASPNVPAGASPSGRWIAISLVTVAAAVATTVVVLRGGPHAPRTPSTSPTTTTSAIAQRPATALPSSEGEDPQLSRERRAAASSSAATTEPSARAARRASPPRVRPQIAPRPPVAVKPSPQAKPPSRGRCSHCKPTDLMCNMECAAKR